MAGRGRPREALPARHERRGEFPRPPRNHQRAVRRRTGNPAAAGAGARAGRLAAAGGARHPAGSLPPERRARGVRRARTRAAFHGRDRPAVRGRARRHAGGQPLHHAHGGGRGLRPLSSAAHRAIPHPVRQDPARHIAPRFPRARPPEPGRRVGGFQHGVPGDPRLRRGQRREPHAREGEPAHFSAALPALARRRSARRPHHQRHPRADLGLGGGRRPLDGELRKGPLAGHGGRAGALHPLRLRFTALANAHRGREVARRVRPRTMVPATRHLRRHPPRRSKRRNTCSIRTR